MNENKGLDWEETGIWAVIAFLAVVIAVAVFFLLALLVATAFKAGVVLYVLAGLGLCAWFVRALKKGRFNKVIHWLEQ